MTATLDRPPASVWAKSLPALHGAARNLPDAAEYVAAWLAILAADPDRAPEFDREIEAYGADLRRAGLLNEYQGAGFVLAVYAYRSVGDPLQETLRQQVTRRQAMRGVVHCRWRGDIPQHRYDECRYDDALRRSGLPSKWERESGRRS